MVYRKPEVAPRSRLQAERQGRVVGRFCLACKTIYPQTRTRHAGKPLYGKDHIGSTCAHEGEEFAVGETWWEPAVEVLADPARDGGR